MIENFMAIGADEVSQPDKEGDLVENVRTGKRGVIELGKDSDGRKSNVIFFITEDGSSYIVGVGGKLLNHWCVVPDGEE